MKYIKLTQDKRTIVDNADFNILSKYRWCFDKSRGYAVSRIDGKVQLLYRFILGLKNGEICDHENRNKLDNRRTNLRLSDKSKNGANRTKQKNNTSGYKGVFLMKDGRKKKYMARMKFKGIDFFIGYYYTKKEAALAYNDAAFKNFGEFAYLNNI